MTNVEAVEHLKELTDRNPFLTLTDFQAIAFAINALAGQTEVNVYDKEETYHNCTVQVLTNTVTGQTSVGWWKE